MVSNCKPGRISICPSIQLSPDTSNYRAQYQIITVARAIDATKCDPSHFNYSTLVGSGKFRELNMI